MDEYYREYILEHYRNPQNYGLLSEYTIKSHGHNPSCGDKLILTLMIKDSIIVQVGFESTSCAIATASASLLSQSIIGKSLQDVRALTKEDMYALVGLDYSPIREKCVMLCLNTLQEMI